ncbi:LuxR family transcriptional regulator [Ruania zhangjianzhongii]|uniref:LuxR family transcriptional regulator n=1 Tax=Ruania zhangjianzhongii TaxID=2603206 RepID=UPI0011C7244D|nr:LuxR family transcriptional regulator [Ruania zhangjianzhongii]
MGVGLVHEARRACEHHAWLDACVLFTQADGETALLAADLDAWAVAAHLTGDHQTAELAWGRAHHGWVDQSDPSHAVRSAFWLGLTLVLAGENARAGAWFARAGRLLEDTPDTGAADYLRLPLALQALHGGHPRDALSTFTLIAGRAGRAGRAGSAEGVGTAATAATAATAEPPGGAADRDLATLARLGQGQSRIALGDAAAGLAILDEAMLAVTDDDVTPLVAGFVYCAVILACRDVFDVRRAQQWTTALTDWCARQQGIQPYQGQCLVHRSELFQLRGTWVQALAAADDACAHLAGRPGDPAQGMAHYQLAELLRLRGEFSRAADEYRVAGTWGHPVQPGMALLRLAEGRIDDALAATGSLLTEAQEPAATIRALAACVEVALAAGKVELARRHLEELVAGAEPVTTEFLRATCEFARGQVLLAEGEPEAAAVALRASTAAWRDLQAPYEAARATMYLGLACHTLGDRDSADLAWAGAREQFTAIGAVTDLARLASLSTGQAGSDRRAPPSALTGREGEILVHVAAGETNRQIATALAISEHTVRRHLQNVFAKLDLPSRAAATAWAYRHDLLPRD